MRIPTHDGMILYHGCTDTEADSILATGLRTKGSWPAYLAMTPDVAHDFGDVILAISVPANTRLSTFEDCADWEVLCWDNISPEHIRRHDA